MSFDILNIYAVFHLATVVVLAGMAVASAFILFRRVAEARRPGKSRALKQRLPRKTRNCSVTPSLLSLRRGTGGHSTIVHAAWAGTVVLLLALVGCSNPLAPPNTPPVHTTPLTLPPGATSPTVPPTSSDWTTYHRDNARTGYLPDMPDPQHLAQAWSKSLDGAVYAEPLVVGNHVLVATEQDSLYSLDAQTGQVQWRISIGSPVPLSELPCGNIDPLGITGTPVYDPATGLVFAVAEVSGPQHLLAGIDVRSGQIRVRRLVDPAGMNPQTQQQRAALALSRGMVYVAFGGLYGDCGDYHGWVVAVRTDGGGPLLSYQVPTTREGGIWGASGPAVDAAGRLYVSVGNGAATSGDWDHSDSVLRLSPALQLEDGFAPQQWQQDNASDADLGSMGPVLLPGGLVYANGKSGLGYLLRADALGGVNGQALVQPICEAYGGAALVGSVLFVPCTQGLQQLLVGPGIQLTRGWQAAGQVTGSPVVGGHTVYSLDPSGTLYALDSNTGMVRATVSVGQTSRFATPTLTASGPPINRGPTVGPDLSRDPAGGRVFVGTLSGVAAVSGS